MFTLLVKDFYTNNYKYLVPSYLKWYTLIYSQNSPKWNTPKIGQNAPILVKPTPKFGQNAPILVKTPLVK